MQRLLSARSGSIALVLVAAALLASCSPGATEIPPTDVPPVPQETATPEPSVTFLASDLVVDAGGCTTLEWTSEGALRLYLDGRGVDPDGTQEVCPTEPTTYTLVAALPDGQEVSRQVAVDVSGPSATEAPVPTTAPTRPPQQPTAVPPTPTATAQPTAAVSVSFFPDNDVYELPKDQLCTAVNWRTTGVTDVQLEREGSGRTPVGPSGREEACFEGRVRYFLYYRTPDGAEQRAEMELRHSN